MAPSSDTARARRDIARGSPLPLGMHKCCDGVNFAVFSRHAVRVTLLLFKTVDAEAAEAQIELDPVRNRTGDIWHVSLADYESYCAYAWCVDGPATAGAGHRFSPARHFVDPYAHCLVMARGEAGPARPRAGIVDQAFDWQGIGRPHHGWSDTVIYELHVRGFTMDPSSAVSHRGQYLGVVEKIPYLQYLGVTAVEIMPVQAFDRHSVARANPRTGERLTDYWGYNPIALFAPEATYAKCPEPSAALVEFKTMVRECHKAGIEVILDVVFNHTGEGGADGPTYSFRGFDNAIYYMLSRDGQRYLDFTGCGNTLNCNHPVVRSLVVACLRHWVVHFHVDGFRFDLASVLGRDTEGNLMTYPPLLDAIAEDPILRDVKLIAEAWDSAGAYQVGSFPGRRWAEWNCQYRCDVRRFWRGDAGYSGRFANRLCGSADLYQHRGQSPMNSVNFITSHDGFTLNDLVSYREKHNHDNGEDNLDGSDVNYSENNGVEGETENERIENVRRRQIRNLLVTLMVSRGVPMLLGGDEFRRTQLGNNNAYCQDNESSWYDWRLVQRNPDLVRFVRKLISLRRRHPVLSSQHFYTAQEITWLGTDGQAPDWRGDHNHVGCVIYGSNHTLCLLFNATSEPARFLLPPPPENGAWHVCIDTTREPPLDAPDHIVEAALDHDAMVTAPARSAIVLATEVRDGEAIAAPGGDACYRIEPVTA